MNCCPEPQIRGGRCCNCGVWHEDLCMVTKDPFRPAERYTRCPDCFYLHAWNWEDKLGGQMCVECGHTFTDHERPSYQAGEPWLDNSVQFARLLAEIRASGLTKEQYKILQDSMDLNRGEIDELLQRAEAAWNQIKSGL